jgi:Protein of unknown function (DUF1573)
MNDKPADRRTLIVALIVMVALVTFGAAAGAAIMHSYSSNSLAVRLGNLLRSGPKAGVDRPDWDLGLIESPEEFTHAFVIHNQGDMPLKLSRGPSTCACTVGNLPDEPIPPGGRADIKVGFGESAKKDELKAGAFSESVAIRTNDPDRENVKLKLSATVRKTLEIKPSPITVNFKTTDTQTDKRSGEAYVYSKTWDHFDLDAVKGSREGIQWRIEPATEEQLKQLEARSGYCVAVTMPPDMTCGEFKERLELAAKPADAKDRGRKLQLEIQGKIEGRLTIFGAKVDSNQHLRLGTITEGESAKEIIIMKVDDERQGLIIERIDAEPDFIRVQVFPIASQPAKVGLYRIEVEIPDNARPGDYMGAHAGTIRVKTDHPRLPVIELKVSFAVMGSGMHDGRIAGR